MKKEAGMKRLKEEKKIVDDELTYTGRNGMTYHVQLIKNLQDPLVEFICAWYGFVIVKWIDFSIQFSLVTKKSFEESVRLGVSKSGELKRCLDFVNFPMSCNESLWLPAAMKSLQRYEKALAKMFSEASYVQINLGGHHLENIFRGCANVEMAKLKLGLMPEIEKPKELV
jgi:hypothetical protein